MSSNNNTHKVKSLTIHLNAGASQRVVDLVNSQKNTSIVINRDAFGDYTDITLTNLSQNDIDTFINKLKNVYPVEFDYNFTPKPKPASISKPSITTSSKKANLNNKNNKDSCDKHNKKDCSDRTYDEEETDEETTTVDVYDQVKNPNAKPSSSPPKPTVVPKPK